MAEDTWRERGEQLFERARRGASPDHAVVDGLLAIYCELRHADEAGSDAGTAVKTALAQVLSEPRSG